MKSVFLIDDHPVVALGLRIAFVEQTTLQLVGTAPDFASGYQALGTVQPDCLVLDLVFAGAVALSNVARAREALPDGTIVIFSSLPARLYARDALAAGADAFLGKNADMGELAALIDRFSARSGSAGDAGVDPSPDRHDDVTVDGVHLTRRELQIAAAIGRGHANDAIADQLALSPKTIAAHRENMRKKLHCRNSKELAVRLALLFGSDRFGT